MASHPQAMRVFCTLQLNAQELCGSNTHYKQRCLMRVKKSALGKAAWPTAQGLCIHKWPS